MYHKKIDDLKIFSGSETLKNCFCDKNWQEYVFLNIHGHTHIGDGKQNLCNIVVLNPGSLS